MCLNCLCHKLTTPTGHEGGSINLRRKTMSSLKLKQKDYIVMLSVKEIKQKKNVWKKKKTQKQNQWQRHLIID